MPSIFACISTRELVSLEQGQCLVAVAADDGPSFRMFAAPHLERVRDVAQLDLRVGPKVAGEPARRTLEPVEAASGEGQDGPTRPFGGAFGRLGSFFEDHVGVGAADAEGAHACPPRRSVALPVAALGHHAEGGCIERDLRVRLLEVEARSQLAVLEHQYGLDQSRHAGGVVEMPDVGLHRAKSTEVAVDIVVGERAGQRSHLDRVSEAGARAVRLHVADGAGRDARVRQGRRHDLGLSDLAGRGEAHLERSVVVDRTSLDDRTDAVAVGSRVLETLEQDRADAAAEDRARGASVERSAVSVGREHEPVLPEVSLHLLGANGGGAGQCGVAAVFAQAAAGGLDGHQRRRAGRLDSHARTAQPELVRNPRGQEVVAVAEEGVEAVFDGGVLGGEQRVVEIGVHRCAGVDAHPARHLVRDHPGALEGFESALEEQTLLGVEGHGLAGREAEEGRIEAVDVVDHRAGLDVVRRIQERRRHAGREQLVVPEERDGLDAGPQVAPEGLHVGRAREAARHADDGDVATHSERLRLRARSFWRARTSCLRAARSRASARMGSSVASLSRWALSEDTVGWPNISMRGSSRSSRSCSSAWTRGQIHGGGAELEEVVVDADALEVEHLGEECRELLLEGVARGHVGRALLATALGRRQGLAVHLPVRGQRQRFEHHEVARHHVLGEALPQVGTQLAHRGGRLRVCRNDVTHEPGVAGTVLAHRGGRFGHPAWSASADSISPSSMRWPRSFTWWSRRPRHSRVPSARQRARSPVAYKRSPSPAWSRKRSAVSSGRSW